MSESTSVMDWMFISTPNSYVEVRTSNVTVSGDGAFMEVISITWCHEDRALKMRLVPLEKETAESLLTLSIPCEDMRRLMSAI